MSAGKFKQSKYTSSKTGDIFAIRIQPETESLVLGGNSNTPPDGIVASQLSARSTGGSRGYGLRARSVTLRWTETAPDGYEPNGTLRVPCLTPEFWNAIIPNATTGTYLGSPVRAIGLTPERLR